MSHNLRRRQFYLGDTRLSPPLVRWLSEKGLQAQTVDTHFEASRMKPERQLLSPADRIAV
jgi:hypothetical protein